MRTKRLGLIGVAALAIVAFSPSVLAANTVVTVRSSDIGNHWYPADTRAPGTGTFETGPATPPYGTGSFELRTITNPEKVQLFTDLYDGTALSSIVGIGYSTYRDAFSTGNISTVASINIRVDLDGGGTSDVYMVYEPYQDMGNAAVLTGSWQDWDAYRGGAAKWWINNGAGGCGQNTPCTWNAIVAAFPNATVREAPNCGPGGVVAPCPGSLGVNQGSFNSGTVSNADGLYVTIGSNTTIYNFEPNLPPPASKDDCKKGGWQNLGRADGSTFKNQGDCIQYANTGK